MTRREWIALGAIVALVVLVPLWLSFRFLRWLLRLAFWSGVASAS